jgi:hypothetical protein
MKRIGLILCFFAFSAQAQYFGQNKARYKTFGFKILQSPHFEMYNYFNNPEMSKRIIVNSEHWYKLHQEVFKTAFAEPNPLIIYKTHPDFQETTAISGQISEGTGGVTEGLKNRVVMPVMYSHRQTDHVLGHELVHAFQYHSMITGDSTTIANMGNLPLFLVEGLAEYMSIGKVDAHTALWMRDGVLNNDLPTIKDLVTKEYKYFPYRWGQAFWAYVAGTYGDDVIRPLFRECGKYGVEVGFQRVLGMDIDRFSVKWKKAMTDYYTPLMVGTTKTAIGKVIAAEEKSGGKMNISPVISPDGKYLAYISEKNVLSIDIYIADAKTGKVLNRINTGGFNAHVDSYSYIESAGTWSPDSKKLAIVIQSKGRNKIMVIDAMSERKKVYDFGNLPESFTNPSWSPNGNQIAVCGLNDGVSDLFLLNLESEKVEKLTSDDNSDLQPTFSPDGRYVYFVTDRNPKFSRPEKANFNLARIDVASKEIENFFFMSNADNLNPQVDPSGQQLYFISDFDGFRNMYRYDLASTKIEKLTNFSTGISGITAFSPTMSIAAKTGQIVYSQYFNGAYNLYSAAPSEFSAQVIDQNIEERKAAMLPPGENTKGRVIVQENLEIPTVAVKLSDGSLKNLAYKPKFKVDYVGSTGMGVGVTNTGRTGMAGGVQGVFSDILGNNQMMGMASLNGEIQDFGAQYMYLNQKKPLQFGFTASHIPYSLAFQQFAIDTLQVNGRNGPGEVPVQKLTISNLRQFMSNLEVFAFRPLSTYQRFEAGGGVNWVNYSLIENSQYYDFFDQFIGEDRKRVDLGEAYRGVAFQQLYLAYVGDNSSFGTTSPLNGYRYRFEGRQMFGNETQLTSYTADVRKYKYLRPVTLATRLMYNARTGRNAGTNLLQPLFLGWMGYMHGFFQEKVRTNMNPAQQLAGSQMAMTNFEIRLPFTGPKRLSAITSNYFISDLSLFFDVGAAWDSKNVVRDQTENIFQGIWGQQVTTGGTAKFDPVMSTGIGLRINALGYLIVEPFYALPIYKSKNSDKLQLQRGTFGLNLTPGW